MAMTPPLPGVLASLAPLLDKWGYLAVGGLICVEDFGVPLPGETVMIVAAVYAGAGRLNIFGVAAIAWCAAVVGDNIGYLIGRTGGRRLVERFGRYVFLTPERIDRAEAFFTRHGGKVILAARFIEGMRQANGIIAGMAHLAWHRFLLYNALGAALWVGAWVSLGYLAGQNISSLYPAIQKSELGLLIATVVIVAAIIVRRVHRIRRKHQRDDEKEGTDGEKADRGTGGEGESGDVGGGGNGGGGSGSGGDGDDGGDGGRGGRGSG